MADMGGNIAIPAHTIFNFLPVMPLNDARLQYQWLFFASPQRECHILRDNTIYAHRRQTIQHIIDSQHNLGDQHF